MTALFLYCFTGFSQTNLVINGDLENWSTGTLEDWESQEGNINQETNITSSGNNSALLIETNSTTEPTIVSKNFILEAGKTYKFSYDFKVKTGRDPFGQQVIGFKFGPVSSFPYSSGNAIPQGYEWESREDEIEITVTEAWKLEVSAFTFIDELFEVYVDNVKVIDINESINSDREALIAFYNALDGPNWTNTWDLTTDISTWYGVELNNDNRVTKIELPGNGLKGSLPPEIGDLEELQILNLNKSTFITGAVHNEISGTIPPEIGNLTKLKEVYFEYLELSGTLPEEIGFMSQLEIMNLGSNNLSGSLPQQIGNLLNLKVLDINSNNFTGAFPSQITNLLQLHTLNMNYNKFSGTIPSEIGNLVQLKEFDIGSNLLTGTIPLEIGSLIQLEKFTISLNNLNGEIPVQIGNLTDLVYFSLSENNISGVIPTEFTNLTKLKLFNAENCNLSGSIPTDIGNLTELEYFNVMGCNLSGTLPTSIGALTELTTFWLNGNNLSGEIPSSIGNLIKLSSLRLNFNEFTGTIPASIGELSSLNSLDLSSNNLTGNIPNTLANLSFIGSIYLNENMLEGTIPENLSSLPGLRVFKVEDNNLSGAIPIFASPDLIQVNLRNNNYVFENIEELLDLASDASVYDYFYQNEIDDTSSITLNSGNEFSISVEATTSSNNIYEWRKNATTIDGATERTFSILNVSSTDSGNYNCHITNSKVPNLVLVKKTTILNISSSNDIDNDGVQNADDDCPNTPAGETVDENGCTVTTVSDSDNDGVADADDDCPNTPIGDTVDENGCTVTTVTDSDNDGVQDADDDCPNTPEGETVDSSGCTISENTLPNISNDGIQVKVTSTSCPNTANGEISVSFTEDYNYTVQITGMLLDNTFDNINASNGLVRSDLSSGSYTVCITVPEYPSYEQCYTVTIETPEEFISGKTVIDYTAKKASVVVSGSKNYQVLVNEKVYSFEVDNSDNQQLSFPLDQGANVISIETDKICQGVFNDSIVLSNAILSPNPVTDMLRVEGLDIMTNAQVILSNLSGVTTLQERKQISNGTLEMNISNLSPGVYMLTIIDGDKEINLKFVKK